MDTLDAFNWQAVFYIFGAVGILIAILWGIIAKDLPEQHNILDALPFSSLENQFALNTAFDGYIGASPIPNKTLVWWSAFTIFTGMIKHHGLLYLVRFLFGIGEAPMYPCKIQLAN
jgi:MFS family permease